MCTGCCVFCPGSADRVLCFFPGFVFFAGHHGGDNSGWSKWLHVVRGRHLTGSGREQARLVKTVKVQVASAEGGPGSDRRLPPGDWCSLPDQGDRYRLGHRPVGSQMTVSPHGEAAALGSMYSQATVSRLNGELCSPGTVRVKSPRPGSGEAHRLHGNRLRGKVVKPRLRQLRGSGSCLLYTSPSPRDGLLSRMPSSA